MNISDIITRQFAWQKTMDSNAEVMWLAGLEEIGELTASLGYADWKKVDRDELNILIEMADIVIFIINVAYYKKQPLKPIIELAPAESDYLFLRKLTYTFTTDQYNQAIRLIVNQNPAVVNYILGKQALNKLRQDYGYKQGEYFKNWGTNLQPIEDNAFLVHCLDKAWTFEETYNYLEDTYLKVQTSRLPL